MRKRLAFGNTWWSERWLKALAHIDNANRLPRGRSYASKGAVSGLVIDGRIIRAQVQGSRREPYQVTIQNPAITQTGVDRLLKKIAGNPVRIARLLNRELARESIMVKPSPEVGGCIDRSARLNLVDVRS